MKKLIQLLGVAMMLFILTGCVEKYERTAVQGVVIDKEHDKAKTYYKTVTVDGVKKKKKVHEKEEFEVVIQYKEIEREFEFENDTFFKTVKVGDAVSIQLVSGIDKEGNVVTEDIELNEK